MAQQIVSNVQSAGGSVQVTAASVAEDVVSHLESALAKAANDEPASKLTGQEFASLEAIIEVTGRPAMRYDDGRVRMPPTDLGDNEKWRVLVAVARSKINKTSLPGNNPLQYAARCEIGSVEIGVQLGPLRGRDRRGKWTHRRQLRMLQDWAGPVLFQRRKGCSQWTIMHGFAALTAMA